VYTIQNTTKTTGKPKYNFCSFSHGKYEKAKSIHVKSKVKAVNLMSVYVTTALRLLDAPTMHSMRSRVYVTVGRPSVRPSVRPIDRQQQRRPAGLLLSAGGVCSRYRPIACTLAAGAQQQMRLASRSESSDEAQHRLVSSARAIARRAYFTLSSMKKDGSVASG